MKHSDSSIKSARPARSLNDFNVPGAYVPTYAPDVSKMQDGATTVRLYREIFGDLAPFAATSYVAMETVATAALHSCQKGEATREAANEKVVKLGPTGPNFPRVRPRLFPDRSTPPEVWHRLGDGRPVVRSAIAFR